MIAMKAGKKSLKVLGDVPVIGSGDLGLGRAIPASADI
jgi:hypothetical protein